MAVSVCSTYGVHVTFEGVYSDSDNLGADVVHDTGVFGRSTTGVSSSTGGEKTSSAATHPIHAFKGVGGLSGTLAFGKMDGSQYGNLCQAPSRVDVLLAMENAPLAALVEENKENDISRLQEKLRQYEEGKPSGTAGTLVDAKIAREKRVALEEPGGGGKKKQKVG